MTRDFSFHWKLSKLVFLPAGASWPRVSLWKELQRTRIGKCRSVEFHTSAVSERRSKCNRHISKPNRIWLMVTCLPFNDSLRHYAAASYQEPGWIASITSGYKNLTTHYECIVCTNGLFWSCKLYSWYCEVPSGLHWITIHIVSIRIFNRWHPVPEYAVNNMNFRKPINIKTWTNFSWKEE